MHFFDQENFLGISKFKRCYHSIGPIFKPRPPLKKCSFNRKQLNLDVSHYFRSYEAKCEDRYLSIFFGRSTHLEIHWPRNSCKASLYSSSICKTNHIVYVNHIVKLTLQKYSGLNFTLKFLGVKVSHFVYFYKLTILNLKFFFVFC